MALEHLEFVLMSSHKVYDDVMERARESKGTRSRCVLKSMIWVTAQLY